MPMGISALGQSGFSASRLFFIAAFAPGQKRNRTTAAKIPTKTCSNNSMTFYMIAGAALGQLSQTPLSAGTKAPTYCSAH